MTPNACSPVSSTPWLLPPAAYVIPTPPCRLTSPSRFQFAALRQALRLCGTPAAAPHRLFKS